VKFILSNSLTPITLRLYRGFHIERIVARRSVSRRAEGRTRKTELLVRNF
jgi:site-specific DNA-adenine methylase